MLLRSTASLFCLAAAVHAQAPAAAPPPTPPAAMSSIAAEELLRHATFLAADELGGRLTGSPGQVAAADYIARHFASLGLEPLGDEVEGGRSFLQHYGIARTSVGPATKLVVGEVELRDGFAVLGGRPGSVRADGVLRFCGLGRTRGANADVGEDERLDGQFAVVAVKPPRGRVGQQLTIEQKFGLSFQTFNQFGRLSKALAKKGAAAVLFVLLEDHHGLADVLNYLALAPGKDTLAARFAGADRSMSGVAELLGGGDGEAPALVLSVGASARLLAQLAIDPQAFAAFVAGDGEAPKAAADVRASLALDVTHDAEATASNVVAVLRGGDPALAHEAIVYSAHMDHVGTRIDGEVFNGADDNASGTAGLLAIAGAFARSAERPARSVIFLAVSGEELGLWGSAYFADHPTWPAADLVANINTDMIGRSGPESGPTEITVTPSHKHAKFSTLVQDAARFAAVLGCTFTSGDKYYQRSDHYNFAKKGIPVVFFCNGEHEDYHQVTDHADKLDGAKMERIARLAFWTGWAVANAPERPRTLGKREQWQ
jgi:Zn-dependent M28 family amino/carboxypeptidase